MQPWSPPSSNTLPTPRTPPCSTSVPQGLSIPQLRTFSVWNTVLQSMLFFVLNTSLATELVSICGAGVVVPVLATEAQGFMNHSLAFYQVRNEGFEVKWTVGEGQCESCAESGGRCGYNSSLGQPICYCPNSNPKGASTNCTNSKFPTALNSLKSSMYPFSPQYIFLTPFFLHCFY